jgi:hypothetical protein
VPGVAARGPDAGTESLSLELGPYRVRVATGYGPRVIGLSLGGGPELFAQLPPEVVIERPDGGTYRFHGGHRLWASPEVPEITYAPDEHPCDVTRGRDQVAINGPADRAGLAKSIVVRLDGGRLSVEHTLLNQGPGTIAAAPWAITQLPLGGSALMPLAAPGSEGLQASHSLVLWPYTDLSDPRLRWRELALVIETVAGPKFKVGSGPAPGRLGYLRQGHLFTKEVAAVGPGTYPDRGAVAQIYADGSFCELESVGPITELAPGEAVSHIELWAVETCDDLDAAYRTVVEGRLG